MNKVIGLIKKYFLVLIILPIKRVFIGKKTSNTRKRRKQYRPTFVGWSLSELLEKLDIMHDLYNARTDRSLTWAKMPKGLRNTETLIVPENHKGVYDLLDTNSTKMDNIKEVDKLPTLMSFGFPLNSEKKDWFNVSKIYAMKINRQSLDWNVFKKAGDIFYEIGVIYKDENNKTVCTNSIIAVNKKTRAVSALKYIIYEIDKMYGYSRKKYRVPQFPFGDDCCHLIEHKKRDVYSENAWVNLFKTCLKAWIERDSFYQISTRKENSWVTFCVYQRDHIKFFKDRDATALINGKRKKIVHYVKEHERKINGKIIRIKPHLRGIRNFSWNGYKIVITVPKFHFTHYKFDVAAQLYDEKEIIPDNTIGLMATSNRLKSIEENKKYKHGNIPKHKRYSGETKGVI